MVRTQIQLTEKQFSQLKMLAATNRVSMAAEIRKALDRHLEQTISTNSAIGRAIASIGGFRSGVSDVSQRHDEHLDDAFSA